MVLVHSHVQLLEQDFHTEYYFRYVSTFDHSEKKIIIKHKNTETKI